MGILGPDTKTIGGKIYEKVGDFYDITEAKTWQGQYQSQGLSARVIPNPQKQVFELFVSFQTVMIPNAEQADGTQG